MPAAPDAAVAVVGAGAAGLGLAVRLAAARLPGVVLVQSPEPAPERTWCSWQRRPVPWADAVAHRWPAADVVGPDGVRTRLDLAPYRYEMVRSRDFEAWAGARLDGVQRVSAHVERVEDGPDAARVVGDGVDLRATWVLDTRPVPPARPGRTALLQHFVGWTVRTDRDAFDPATASLMDFRLPQPAGGVAFGYVLPTSPREALVEHTVFSRTAWPDADHEDGLRRYAAVLGLPPHEVLAVERGAIPMTDAPFPRRAGRRVFRLGAAGGATRPSTGYTFTAAQRQAAAVAHALVAGRQPLPPPAWPRRHRAMDAVLLRALDAGRLDGAAYLADLFARHPAPRVLRFLDGDSTPLEELAVMARSPRGPMLRSLVGNRSQ
ncbi:MAG TPA: lycopene cyclase family protein [Mycobacteriales bacterium]|nr:lycopene cyclase family protein [Mycobacteriales bacterium]